MSRGDNDSEDVMTNANLTPELLTPKEKAAELKVSESTLARWRCQQTGPRFVRLGRSKACPVRYFRGLS